MWDRYDPRSSDDRDRDDFGDRDRVSRGGKYVHLGATLFRLLQYLLERPRTVFSLAELV